MTIIKRSGIKRPQDLILEKTSFCSKSPSERYCQSIIWAEHTFHPGLISLEDRECCNKKMTVCRFLLHFCHTIYPLPRFLCTCKLISFRGICLSLDFLNLFTAHFQKRILKRKVVQLCKMPWIPRLFYLYWSFKPILWELNLPFPPLACLLLMRPFFLVPTTSKRLLRKLS